MYECHKIGKDQQLEIESWSQKLQYEICANVLAQGMQIHLRVSFLLVCIYKHVSLLLILLHLEKMSFELQELF